VNRMYDSIVIYTNVYLTNGNSLLGACGAGFGTQFASRCSGKTVVADKVNAVYNFQGFC
jgi:hypothetical protein